MQSIAFAIPILPGRAERVLAHAEHLIQGERHQEKQAHARSRGLRAARFYHQTNPAEMLIIYLEAPNLDKALTEIHEADHEFEDEFRVMVEEATGHKPKTLGPFPAHLIMDWHHEEGHRHRNPRAHLAK